MPEKILPVWETYNGQIADMRRQGHTLQAIGDTVGVTRERVRQVLARYYGRVKPLLLPEYNVARVIGCRPTRLVKLREHGTVSPVKRGKRFWLYDRNEIEKAMLALQRNCAHCGEPLPIQQISKYCTKCQTDYRRNAYPFRSDEGKKKALGSTIKWQKEHPEQSRKYYHKHKEELKARARKYYYEHIEEERTHARKYYHTHIEEERTRGQRYLQEHRDEIKAYQQKYHHEHREKRRIYSLKYYYEHIEEQKARRRKYYYEHKIGGSNARET